MKKNLLYFGLGVMTGAAAIALTAERKPQSAIQVPTVVTIRRDTVMVKSPAPAHQRILPKRKRSLTATAPSPSDSTATDSAGQYLQRVYSGEGYTAWISGIDPVLDSVAVHPLSVVSVNTLPTASDIALTPKTDTKHWHLGLFGGCAVTTRGLQPAIGIGITYSFCSW